MSTGIEGELAQFHHFVGVHLEAAARGAALSPEEILDEWRRQHPCDDDDDAVAALREALADLQAGDRGTPLADFDVEFRRRRGLTEAP